MAPSPPLLLLAALLVIFLCTLALMVAQGYAFPVLAVSLAVAIGGVHSLVDSVATRGTGVIQTFVVSAGLLLIVSALGLFAIYPTLGVLDSRRPRL